MDADANTDAAEKAAAKAERFEGNDDCEAALFDQNDDGSATAVGENCEGVGGRHIRYVGGSGRIVAYRVTPSVVDGWTMDADANVDAAEKATAKAERFETNGDCEGAVFDQNDDGTATPVGANNCEGVVGADGSRSGHPGTAGGPSSASGGNSRFTNAGILGCIRAVADHVCTYQELIDYHTANSLGGYGN